MAQMDGQELGACPDRYSALREQASGLPDVDFTRWLHVDLWKPVESATLGPEVSTDLLRTLSILRFYSPTPRRHHVLVDFARRFTERYETAWVPLVEVLDEELGLAFARSGAPGGEPAPLLDGVRFQADAPAESVPWGPREHALLRLLIGADPTQRIEVELPDLPPRSLATGRPLAQLADSFAVIATLARDSATGTNPSRHELLFKSCIGPSGANLLGRFCPLSAELTERLREHLRDEEAQDPESIFAEIVHLPNGRAGNIVLRPELRDHSIVFLSDTETGAKQIPIDDLEVTVHNAAVVLRSRTLGRRVRPRLSTAHNFFNQLNLGIYRFLCALQWEDGTSPIAWDWTPFHNLPFLPRIRTGNVVLSRARWLMTARELKVLAETTAGAERFRRVQQLRASRALPRCVVQADGDNELLIDFDNILSIDAWIGSIRTRQAIQLLECYPSADHAAVDGPGGQYACEIIVPFLHRRKETRPSISVAAEHKPVQRVRAPGSDWLFIKLYTGPASADDILRDPLQPLLRRLLESRWIDRWFFLRYGDPHWHIRLRLQGAPITLQKEVLPLLTSAIDPLLETRQVWRLQLDTYQREVERYGGPVGIAFAEQIFHADSEAALEFLVRHVSEELREERWRFTFLAIHRLLTELGLDLGGRRAVMFKASESFAREFGFTGTELRHQISTRFREERESLQTMVDAPDIGSHSEILSERSKLWADSVSGLINADRAGSLSDSIENIALSLAHMTSNRLFRASARAQELFVYSFLYRLYDSQIAQNRTRLPSR
jgi:thiopeptide-type bacteriocin biosynthesis protein